MSDSVQIATAFFAMLSTMFGGYMAYKMAQLNQKQARAAIEVREVKQTLETSTASQDRKLDTILHVADGALGKQMRIAADALRVIADKTGDPGHIATADNAERDYRDHERSQEAAEVRGPIAVTVVNTGPLPVSVVEAQKPKEGEPGNPPTT